MTTELQDTAVKQPETTAPTGFPIEFNLALSLKIKIEDMETFKYYNTENFSLFVIADLFDMIEDQMAGQLLSINEFTREEVRKKLQTT
jgi:hypothetical protein